ncbi:unnamed protein product [Adineta steineri]|uniref:Protein kinase domain-containing protein n=1 Tax=Adineta steineri TaxID=433720 RepID=A0A815P055_9BILA|nr:unnamed protein product [Adineta steineri]CAF1441211.1 unnamed protein product [Adineta steineri]CAF1442237.1 unnamed protein product [Adineta steineri]
MGGKTSKYQNEYISTQQRNPYENVTRAYAKWDRYSGLMSDDTSCFATHEIENFKKHQKISQNSSDQQRKVNSSNEKSIIKKTGQYDKNLSKQSQSIEQIIFSKNRITAQQLIKDQSQRRQKYKSTTLLSSNDLLQNSTEKKASSTTNINQTKQIPNDFQLLLIHSLDLQNAHEIGKGNFGTVYRALYKGTRDVALKTLKSVRHNLKSSIEDYDDNMYELLYEAHIMTQLQHPNLLRIIGVTFFGKDKQLSLVTDFMKNGSLLDYLRKHREIFLKSKSKDITLKLNSFSKQIFQAMLYLEKRRIIHRDLAARNCLIGDEDTLKVGDFGLTKLTEGGLYKGNNQTICAIRWSSPEAIFYSKYTSRSDVWSYGITLWEIYSLGERPYGSLDNKTVKNLLKNPLENFTRFLPQSREFGSDEVYTHLMLPCLTYNVALRPRFKDLVQRILTIFNNNIR